MLEALRFVDEVRIFDGPDARQLIEEIKPDILTNGYGYKPEKVVGRDIVESYGGKIVVTYSEDASGEEAATTVPLSTTKILGKRMRTGRYYNHPGDVIEVCRIATGYSVNPFEKLKLLADEYMKVADMPGAVADLGSWRGGTALVLRQLAPKKHLYLFDTWEGTPYDDPLCHHKRGEWATDLDGCKQVVGNGELTHYCKGVFPCLLDCTNGGQFSFVFVDMDTYQATKDALEFFWPRLSKGGKIVVDDYGWEPCAGVKKAVDEYFPPDEIKRYGPDAVYHMSGVPRVTLVGQLHTCIIEKV